MGAYVLIKVRHWITSICLFVLLLSLLSAVIHNQRFPQCTNRTTGGGS